MNENEEKKGTSESAERPLSAIGYFSRPNTVPNPYFVPRRFHENDSWEEASKRFWQIVKEILQIYVKNGLNKDDIDYVANLVALAVNDRPLTKEYVDGLKP